MKKFISTLGIVLFLGFIITTSVLAQSLNTARIIYVEGQVEVQFAQTGNWVRAKKGMILKKDDFIRTSHRSAAELIIFEKKGTRNTIKIAENTSMMLVGDPQINSVLLPKGKIFSTIIKMKRGSTFEVYTPTAVAGVRGSGFEIETDGKNDEDKAFEDGIHVDTYDERGRIVDSIDIPEGFKVNIEDSIPSELIELTLGEIGEFEDWREEVQERIEKDPEIAPEEEAPAKEQIKTREEKKEEEEEAAEEEVAVEEKEIDDLIEIFDEIEESIEELDEIIEPDEVTTPEDDDNGGCPGH